MKFRFKSAWLVALYLAAGCSGPSDPKNQTAVRTPQTASPFSQTNSNPTSPDPHIVSVIYSTRVVQFLAIPDELTVALADPIQFPRMEHGPSGEHARFGILGYPRFSDSLLSKIREFESENPSVRVRKLTFLGSLRQSLRQDWKADPSLRNTIFHATPPFGIVEERVSPVPIPVSFYKTYQMTSAGARFLQMLTNAPEKLSDYFGFRFCFFAVEKDEANETLWQGDVCTQTSAHRI